MAGKEDPVRSSAAVGGGSAPDTEKEADAPSLGKEAMEKEAVTVTGLLKRKAEEVSEGPAAADATVVVPAVGEVFVDEATGIKYVDMPESYLCWVLSQKRISPSPYDPREYPRMSQQEIERELASMKRLDELLEGVEEEFFEFQDWVRKTYETKGRVLVPVESIPKAFKSAD